MGLILRQIFDELDDGTSYFSVAEFRNFMTKHGEMMSNEEFDEMLRDIDPEGDNDGKLAIKDL